MQVLKEREKWDSTPGNLTFDPYRKIGSLLLIPRKIEKKTFSQQQPSLPDVRAQIIRIECIFIAASVEWFDHILHRWLNVISGNDYRTRTVY